MNRSGIVGEFNGANQDREVGILTTIFHATQTECLRHRLHFDGTRFA